MQSFSINPGGIFGVLWKNRALIVSSIKHEVLGRYKGSIIGVFWSFLNPLFMLTIYTVVFGEIFKSRWDHNSSSKTEFALVLFSGLIIFNIFSECMTRSPNLIVNNPGYVKKIIYPLEILPWVAIGTSLFHALISIIVWITAYAILISTPHLTILFLPLLLIPFLLFVLGLSWLFAALGVYIRDISQVMGLIITSLMFLSPIFYPISAIPEGYRFLLYLNPLTPIIEQTRDIMYWGKLPDFKLLVSYTFTTFLIAWGGFAWFQKTRKGFADVL